MNENNRLMLEGLYITGEIYCYSKKVREMMNDYLYDINTHFKIRKFGGKYYPYCYKAHSIIGVYANKLSLTSDQLRKAKEKANKVFIEYMDLKKEIVDSGAYADPEIRNIFNQKKNEWREVSMNVIETKANFYSQEIEYNAIVKYVNATSEYIKFLEQNQKE